MEVFIFGYEMLWRRESEEVYPQWPPVPVCPVSVIVPSGPGAGGRENREPVGFITTTVLLLLLLLCPYEY
jgi:hypothetical protein